MNDNQIKTAAVSAVAYTVVVFLVGFLVRGWLDTPEPAHGLATTAQAEIRIAPDNVIASRAPVVQPEPAVPPPKGVTVTRTAHVVVKPKPIVDDRKLVCECEPLRIDLTQFTDETGERLQFTTPSGEILEASDKPVIGEIAGEPRRNALGFTWRPEVGGNNVYGVLYQRDLWERVRVGAKVEHDPLSGVQGEIQALFKY